MFKKIKNYLKVKKDFVFIFLIVLLGIPTSVNLLRPGYFSMHDDIQAIRLYEMERCLLDGQIPCRWSPDMTAGYGQPLYNFYSVFPYYTGVSLRIFNLQFIDIAKILFLFTLIPSGIFMYLLVKEFFGRPAGLIGAIFFLYAPYHAIDSYVRGALAEAFAITFFPLIFLSIYKLIKEEKIGWLVSLVFSLSAVFLSHNIMNMIMSPFVVLWVIFCLVYLKKIRALPKILLGLLWAMGISSFFLIPAFLEKKYVTIESLMMNYYDFHLHFVTKGQLLFSRYWDYGPSAGVNSRMSFQIGWPHWWMIIAVIPFLIFFLKKKVQIDKVLMTVFFVFMFLVSSFFTHSKSLFLWESIPMLPFVQFPWRFLGAITFSCSFVAGAVFYFFQNAFKKKVLSATLFVLLIASVIGLNYSYFRPQYFYEWMTDEYKFSWKEMPGQMKSAMLDYLPKTVKKVPEELAPLSPWTIEGKADISEFAKRSDFWRFTVDVQGNIPAIVKVPVLDFPRWKVFDNSQEVSFSNDNQEGVIQIKILPGKHTIVGWFEDTPIRKVANLISLFSFASLVCLVVIKGKKGENTI